MLIHKKIKSPWASVSYLHTLLHIDRGWVGVSWGICCEYSYWTINTQQHIWTSTPHVFLSVTVLLDLFQISHEWTEL